MVSSGEFFSVPIGQALVQQGELSREQVDQVLQMQKNGDKRLFGEIAVDMGYLDLLTVIRYLEAEDRGE
ncbi:hypothetical protein [Marispirochaeta aestuarii]|uniref:Type II secretion system protein GspE N-terminal domain-containing protein n=1 Tax=Marispirochaeta aestuarii TaxID=1963862 RepID=A0A1Y1S2U3_9SPIO|nr:hypothetical protein [Marispirochaeta aestuarii]ORC38298.1 hypothetical protein B4O97_00645 [Marispirochaeta aestuarii]